MSVCQCRHALLTTTGATLLLTSLLALLVCEKPPLLKEDSALGARETCAFCNMTSKQNSAPFMSAILPMQAL